MGTTESIEQREKRLFNFAWNLAQKSIERELTVAEVFRVSQMVNKMIQNFTLRIPMKNFEEQLEPRDYQQCL
jgi:hypothetical protein